MKQKKFTTKYKNKPYFKLETELEKKIYKLKQKLFVFPPNSNSSITISIEQK